MAGGLPCCRCLVTFDYRLTFGVSLSSRFLYGVRFQPAGHSERDGGFAWPLACRGKRLHCRRPPTPLFNQGLGAVRTMGLSPPWFVAVIKPTGWFVDLSIALERSYTAVYSTPTAESVCLCVLICVVRAVAILHPSSNGVA